MKHNQRSVRLLSASFFLVALAGVAVGGQPLFDELEAGTSGGDVSPAGRLISGSAPDRDHVAWTPTSPGKVSTAAEVSETRAETADFRTHVHDTHQDGQPGHTSSVSRHEAENHLQLASDDIPTSAPPVPEPGTLAIIALCLLSAAAAWLRRRWG